MATREMDQSAKRQRILQAATTCFARGGYDETCMSDVAERAGVSKGSLYDYFKNKEDLFYAVFEGFQSLLMQAAAPMSPSAGSCKHQMMRMVEVTVKMIPFTRT